MPAETLIHYAREALYLMAALSLPVVGVAAVVGLVVAALQAATQIQDPTLAHLPRMLAVMAALAVMGTAMAHELGGFAARIFSLPSP